MVIRVKVKCFPRLTYQPVCMLLFYQDDVQTPDPIDVSLSQLDLNEVGTFFVPVATLLFCSADLQNS